MKAYKLTNENGQTRGGMQWGEGVTHSAMGNNPNLCSNGWIHFYTDLLLAVFMNPAHARFKDPIAWECETAGEELHGVDKSGCKTLTTLRRVELPVVTITQRMAFGILCAKKVCLDAPFQEWANKWLNGTDRGYTAAYAYTMVASIATYASAAAYAAAFAAAYAGAAVYANAAAAAADSGCIKSTAELVALAREAMSY